MNVIFLNFRKYLNLKLIIILYDYRFLPNTVKWFRSFLSGRTQRVKIGANTSAKKSLTSGVPQGGVISPLIFVLYASDLEFWLKWSIAKTYADDTMTCTSAKTKEELIIRMEEDANNILSYMASNGLIANASKTSLVILNLKKKDKVPNNPLSATIGGIQVTQVDQAKLLGITFNEKQNWNSQIQGIGGVVASLNKQMFIIKRLKNHIGPNSLKKVVDGLFTSKMYYGLQLYGKVRSKNSDPMNGDINAIQSVQNKMARFLNSKTLKDKIETKKLLANIDMLSVNQLNAKIKILEVWKALNVERYPLSIPTKNINTEVTNTRAMTSKQPIEIGKRPLTQRTCISDAIKVWNSIPVVLKQTSTLHTMKKATKTYVKTLPI